MGMVKDHREGGGRHKHQAAPHDPSTTQISAEGVENDNTSTHCTSDGHSDGHSDGIGIGNGNGHSDGTRSRCTTGGVLVDMGVHYMRMLR
jgi:hypothetical protein